MISWLRFKWRKYYRRYYLHTGGRAEKLRSAPDRLHVLKLHLVELTEQVIYLLKGDMRSRAGRSGRREEGREREREEGRRKQTLNTY